MMKTPLYDEHLGLNAKMTQFAGWEMPLYYSGIVHEVGVVRSAVGIFDLSHMGELMISGTQSLDLIQRLLTNDASRMEIGRAQYTLMCNENGGVLDDLVAYRLDDDTYMLVVNASNAEADFAWILEHNDTSARCENRSAQTGLIAVQGPSAEDALRPLTAVDIHALRRFHITHGRVGDVNCWIARTGYTGEDGFELYCDAANASSLWAQVMQAGQPFGIEPVGLGARDILRLEAGYPLYGNELTTDTTPVEARLLWVVKPDKGDFIGRDTILQAMDREPERLLIGIEALERCVPRHGYELFADDAGVGCVTSGSFSPTLNKAIAMAYVDTRYTNEGTKLNVDIRGRLCACQVVALPFYRPERRVAASASGTGGG